MLKFELPWDSQPQEVVELGDFNPEIVWYAPRGPLLHDGRAADTFTGARTVSQAGQAVAHNGSSQRENWVISNTNAFPFVLAGSFVVTETSTGVQTAFSLGGATDAGGLYTGVGQYAAGSVGSWARVRLGASDAAINGPTAVIGTKYNVIRISRSATDHVMYVNGVRYTSSTNSGTPDDSWKNATVGACVRNVTPVFYGKQTVHMGFAAFSDPGDEWARRWSENEFSIFAPRSIWVPVSAGGAPTFNPAWARNSNTVLVGGRL